MKRLIATLIALSACLPAAAQVSFSRIAYCADGNEHDTDDIGATAMAQALLWGGGAQPALVHFEYSNHIGANTPWQYDEMEISANGNSADFGIPNGVLFNVYDNITLAAINLSNEITASSATDRLLIIQAGPWESMAVAYDLAPMGSHQHTTIVSHSLWNNNHRHLPHHRGRKQFFEQYEAGPFAQAQRPGYVKIQDQGAFAFDSDIAEWDWLLLDPELSFVHARTLASITKAGDMSDSGCIWWALTGNQQPTMPEVRAFFGL